MVNATIPKCQWPESIINKATEWIKIQINVAFKKKKETIPMNNTYQLPLLCCEGET